MPVGCLPAPGGSHASKGCAGVGAPPARFEWAHTNPQGVLVFRDIELPNGRPTGAVLHAALASCHLPLTKSMSLRFASGIPKPLPLWADLAGARRGS